mmetsp:Transcript_45576/g.90359  ORF Transcript_45576/g.90359 Transcript_45576/m.90359 type:complete len:243 (+) Transcript_45576:58-786(+)
MSASLRRFFGTGAGRRLLVPGVRTAPAAAQPAQLLPQLQPLLATRCWGLQRPLGALAARPLSSNAAFGKVHGCVHPNHVLPPAVSQPDMENLGAAAAGATNAGRMAIKEEVATAGSAAVQTTASTNAMVFEIGFTFIFMHYQSIFIFFARGLFQAFRPLLILFVFGQILKAVFFVAGAPIWCSFYSIWMFEVIYGLAQCAISFIFICSFYNNLSFARLRPALSQALRQERKRLQRAAQHLSW